MYCKCIVRFLGAICLMWIVLVAKAHPACSAEDVADKQMPHGPDSVQYMQEVTIITKQPGQPKRGGGNKKK